MHSLNESCQVAGSTSTQHSIARFCFSDVFSYVTGRNSAGKALPGLQGQRQGTSFAELCGSELTARAEGERMNAMFLT